MGAPGLTGTMRLLFFNEGNLGTHILGQGQLDDALRVGLEQAPDVQARFVGLEPFGRLSGALAQAPLGPLAARHLDMRAMRWHAVQSVRARARLDAELRAFPADVVHVHTQSVALAMGHLARRLPLAISLDTTIGDWADMPAWRIHESYASLLSAPSRAAERRIMTRAATVLAWTGWARRAVERVAPQARVVEHHPGIDLERYRPAPRTPREMERVLFVGGRFAEKGGEDLLAVLEPQLGVTVELDLVTPAEVPERPGVRVHRLGPGDPALLELQQQADVFCLPSYGDAAPWAVLEAMACGTVVLGSDVGGIPDMLEGGHAGVVVAHGDRRVLGEALGSLLGSPELREQLAGRARERCERVYDARLQTRAMLETFTSFKKA